MSDYTEQVRGYLADCRKAARELTLKGSALDPKYHPTEDGAVKLIFHNGDKAEAKKIRETFRALNEPAVTTRNLT